MKYFIYIIFTLTFLSSNLYSFTLDLKSSDSLLGVIVDEIIENLDQEIVPNSIDQTSNSINNDLRISTTADITEKVINEKNHSDEKKVKTDLDLSSQLDSATSDAVLLATARKQLQKGYDYFNGDNGVEKNYRKAVIEWELASKSGLAQAQVELGISYMHGEGVNYNPAIAYMWISNSIIEFYSVNRKEGLKNSHRNSKYRMDKKIIPQAKEALMKLYGNMPSSDLIKGTNLANSCYKQKFKNCESDHLTYSIELEKKANESNLPICPKDDPKKLYQLKWNNCFGAIENENGRYEGEFKDGYSHGQGLFVWKMGNKYEGEYVKNMREGYGVQNYANGDVYEGMWLNDAFDGPGKLTWADGKVEEGIYKNFKLINENINIDSKLINVNKEYVTILTADVYENPFLESTFLQSISRGSIVLVAKKTDVGDWYLLKDVKNNMIEEDAVKIIGYSPAEFFISLETVYSGKTDNLNKFSKLPGSLLFDSYLNYIIIKKMHQARVGYSAVYINDDELAKAKTLVKEIEETIVSQYQVDEGLVWDLSINEYKKSYSAIDLIVSSGLFSNDGSRLAKINLMGLNIIAEEVTGNHSIEKDF